MSVWLPGAPQDQFHDLDNSYCGYPATQCPADFVLWRVLLGRHLPERIVELGTAWGGFSLFLSHQATARSMEFVTFDKVDHRTASPDWTFGNKAANAADLGDQFVCADVLADPAPVAIELANRKVALLCDNGDKPAEVNLYGPMLTPESICVVHDWGTEIGPDDIPDCLTEIHGDLCDELHSASRVFIR
jgi:cephalosporin hydroxylase